MPERISLLDAGALRDAIDAHTRGDRAALAYALAVIDPAAWRTITDRMRVLADLLPTEAEPR